MFDTTMLLAFAGFRIARRPLLALLLAACTLLLRAPAPSEAFGLAKVDCSGYKDDNAALQKKFGRQYNCAMVKFRNFCTNARWKAVTAQFCKKTCASVTMDCAATKQPTAQPTRAGTAGFFLGPNRTWCAPHVCCCDAPWRGLHCEDFDECSSRPCRNGGACEDSSRTKYVNDYRRK